jgi:hypothetical protein
MSSSPTWWSLNLGDGILAAGIGEQIRDEFCRVHAAAGSPASMAVLIGRIEGDLHCQVIAYFSPACGQLALQAGAKPCARPNRAGVELLAGSEDCWQLLFPQG